MDFARLDCMQPAWAILLVCLFSSELIGSALVASHEAKLPACCRGEGKHRCGMKSMAGVRPATSASVRSAAISCPLYPKGNIVPASGRDGAPAPVAGLVVPVAIWHPDLRVQAEARQRVSFSRTCPKRGPPFLQS